MPSDPEKKEFVDGLLKVPKKQITKGLKPVFFRIADGDVLMESLGPVRELLRKAIHSRNRLLTCHSMLIREAPVPSSSIKKNDFFSSSVLLSKCSQWTSIKLGRLERRSNRRDLPRVPSEIMSIEN